MKIQTFELSDFGGEYEDTVQKMVWAGVQFMQQHGIKEFPSVQYENIYGIADNSGTESGRQFDEAIRLAAGEYGCSGAMHQAATNHARYIGKYGYHQWFKEMTIARAPEEPYEFEFNGEIDLTK